jgi:hypothetical protein
MKNQYARYLARLFMALPFLSLALGAFAWLHYGMDMPWFDDWRGYAEGNIGSFDRHYLFRAVNDTLAPVGFALDAVAQWFLDGNSVAYQFLSMTTVLGSLLWLQWLLLRKTMSSTLEAAACFTFTLLMLQPGSYWGLENLAYHQCLPLVFILVVMWIIFCSETIRVWQLAAVFAFGLIAGFTYISGAFAVLTAGFAMLAVTAALFGGVMRRRMLSAAALFTLAGALTSTAQFYFSLLKFHSAGTHAGIKMALPTESAFWMFYLGKIGRSLLLSPSERETSLAIVGVACLATLWIALALFRRSAAPESTVQGKRLAGIYLTLLAVIVIYLMLVAAGRANYHGPEVRSGLDIFALGFTRFHFFWVTLLWPWVVAAMLSLAGAHAWARRMEVRAGALAGVMALIGLMVAGGAYDHSEFHRELADSRLPMAHCLLQELQKGGQIRCPGLLPSRFTDLAPDAYPAYLNARKMGASFVRYFPLLPKSKRREDLAPFYVVSAKDLGQVSELEHLVNDTFRAIGSDPQFHLVTGQAETMRRCTTLDVEIEIKTGLSDMAQVFYQPIGATQYDEQHSSRNPVGGDDVDALQLLTFRMESTTGFRDTLRLDPATKPQKFDLRRVRLYCLRQQP